MGGGGVLLVFCFCFFRLVGFFLVCFNLKCILPTEKIQTLTVTVLKLFTIIFIFMETQDDIASSKNSFWLPILTWHGKINIITKAIKDGKQGTQPLLNLKQFRLTQT